MRSLLAIAIAASLLAACTPAPQQEPLGMIEINGERWPVETLGDRWVVRVRGQTLFCTKPTTESCYWAARNYLDTMDVLNG
ncbi:hypothetical protein [Albidovulum sp.]|jgi:hypothetical protein|uniref:hypothetical protein n=1 Tax=Albidovulum sp. TaxID=1872424 RepID=UPI00304102EC